MAKSRMSGFFARLRKFLLSINIFTIFFTSKIDARKSEPRKAISLKHATELDPDKAKAFRLFAAVDRSHFSAVEELVKDVEDVINYQKIGDDFQATPLIMAACRHSAERGYGCSDRIIQLLISKGADVDDALKKFRLEKYSFMDSSTITFIEEASVCHLLAQLRKDSDYPIPEWQRPLVIKHKNILRQGIKGNKDLLAAAVDPNTPLGEIFHASQNNLKSHMHRLFKSKPNSVRWAQKQQQDVIRIKPGITTTA
jgi:hypothetical protein